MNASLPIAVTGIFSFGLGGFAVLFHVGLCGLICSGWVRDYQEGQNEERRTYVEHTAGTTGLRELADLFINGAVVDASWVISFIFQKPGSLPYISISLVVLSLPRLIKYTSSFPWCFLLAFQVIPNIILLLTVFLPKSPRWLITT